MSNKDFTFEALKERNKRLLQDGIRPIKVSEEIKHHSQIYQIIEMSQRLLEKPTFVKNRIS